MAMSAAAAARSSLLRSAIRRATPAPKRNFAASAHHDDAYEAKKWEVITYIGMTGCTLFGIYVLSKGHPHHQEQPAYPYLHIRNKEFPWGPDGLFEIKHHD